MEAIAADLLAWYDKHRRILPWREDPTVYRVWISEVMLQQTRVDTVLPYFENFMGRFPTVDTLAEAPLDDVLKLWSGLGYYSRARNLHKTALAVSASGEFPSSIEGLRELSGVGEYMAGAIGSIALGLDVPTVDGNIARVMARIHEDGGSRKAMWAHAERLVPAGRAGDHNQALMDLGARICTPKSPSCSVCPISSHCLGFGSGEPERFPLPKPKRPSPILALRSGCYLRENMVWMAQRGSEGLWAGLWEFPQIGREFDGKKIFETKHILTHRRVEFELWFSQSDPPKEDDQYQQYRWIPLAEVGGLGISALTRRALGAVQSAVKMMP